MALVPPVAGAVAEEPPVECPTVPAVVVVIEVRPPVAERPPVAMAVDVPIVAAPPVAWVPPVACIIEEPPVALGSVPPVPRVVVDTLPVVPPRPLKPPLGVDSAAMAPPLAFGDFASDEFVEFALLHAMEMIAVASPHKFLFVSSLSGAAASCSG